MLQEASPADAVAATMLRMRTELVSGAGIARALDEWSVLHAADPVATPFASPGWALAWLRHWRAREQPWVLLVHEGSRVAGVAPLTLQRFGHLRVLGMLGKEPGDYWDVVAAPADRAAVGAAVAEELMRRRRDWDVGILSCLIPGSATGGVLAANGLRIMHRPAVACPAITLPGTWDEYLGTLPRGRRGNLRRHLRRLDDGEVELREVRDAAELPGVLTRWQELRERQWDVRGRSLNPSHRTKRFRDFLLDAVQALVPAGQAIVWEFRVDGRTAGIYVNFVDSRSFYWYLGGFDPAHSTLGIGKIAIAAGIRQSIECGRARYDFTRGSEEYKYWFGAVDRMAPSIVVGHPGPRSRAALAGARVENARRTRAATRLHRDDGPQRDSSPARPAA
jgi:CelD/BcsL family acetyltransferase involved in cellulose biosynthesis